VSVPTPFTWLPTFAHGGVEGALGMPFSLYLYLLAALLLVVYLALRAQPAPLVPSSVGRSVLHPPTWLRLGAQVGGHLLGAVVWLVVLTAGLFGTESSASNIIWLASSVGLLAAFSFVSVLVGDLWRALSPFRGLGLLARRWVPDDAEPPAWAGWVAPAGVLSLAWFLLARENVDEPRGLGAWMLVYSLVIVAGTLRWGLAWVHRAEGFGVLFGLFASLAFLHGEQRDDDAQSDLRVRWPLVGAAGLVPTPGAALTLAAGLALVLFDLFSTTDLWLDLLREADGTTFVLMQSAGLLLAFGLAVVVAMAVGRGAGDGPDAGQHLPVLLVPGFVGVVAGLTIAQDLPTLLIDGQFLPILASDPYGQGWDLFGTSANVVEFEPLTAAVFAWIEYGAIIVGSLASLLVGHDVLASRDDVRPLSRSLFVLGVAVGLVALAGLAMVLGASAD
jgi:hypothetical protein